jgi:hypothetical protein
MAIAFKTASAKSQNNITHTYTVDMSTGADKFVMVLAGNYSAGTTNPALSATCDSVSLTAGTLVVFSQGTAHRFMAFWGLTSATSATTSIVITYTSDQLSPTSMYVVMTGVGSVRGTEFASQGNSTTPASASVTSATGDTVLNLIILPLGSGRTITATSGAADVYDSGDIWYALTKDGAANVTVDGTLSGLEQWCSVALSLVPAGATSTQAPRSMLLGVG